MFFQLMRMSRSYNFCWKRESWGNRGKKMRIQNNILHLKTWEQGMFKALREYMSYWEESKETFWE